MKSKVEQNFQELTDKLELLNILSEASDKIEENCKLGFKKLSLSRSFAEIDNKILDYSIQNLDNDKDFLFSLLNLETKRLRFKEQTNKCNSKKTKIKIST
ncbi:MAG: hypothetical protein RLZZ361_1190 [Cyanobacteriota bacterium]|jgi:hypothetical protein